MASVNGQGVPQSGGGHHQRTKSSVLRSFMMHRRNNSQGENLTAAALVPSQGVGGGPLEDISHNRQQQPQLVHAEKHPISRGNSGSSYTQSNMPASSSSSSSSPTKKTKLGNTTIITSGLPSTTSKSDADKVSSPPPSPTKKDRGRSTTNLVGLLSRPKSFKNLHKMAKDEAEAGEERGRGRSRGDDKKRSKSRLNIKDNRDKENQARPGAATTADNSATANSAAPPQVTPIYAQFCSTSKGVGRGDLANKPLPSLDDAALGGTASRHVPAMKPRPKSFHPVSASVGGSTPVTRSKLMTAFSSTRQMQHTGASTPSAGTPSAETPSPFDLPVDPNNIDAHLEALLDRRNIPEHQRYKMRNLANAIKMELIRQDWAEERSKRQQQAADRPQSNDSARSASGNSDQKAATNTPAPASTDEGSAGKSTKSKHSRVKSMTFSKVTRGRSRDRGSNDSTKRPKSPGAPLKKKNEGTLGRHLRSKSTESFVNMGNGNGAAATSPDAASSANSSNPITGFFAKATGPQQNSPADFVTYLRTVQAPEKMEVGKLHKLRLLLRNETVAWIEDFIDQGGMEEVVGLLHRIMAVEWR